MTAREPDARVDPGVLADVPDRDRDVPSAPDGQFDSQDMPTTDGEMTDDGPVVPE